MNREEFKAAIDWDAPLSCDMVKKLYGYSLCYTGFLIDVLAEYEKHGRDKVRYVYRLFAKLEEEEEQEQIRPIAEQLLKQIDTEYERKVKEYERNRKYKSGDWHRFRGFPPIQ